MAPLGVLAIAEELGRTPKAVKLFASKNGISLRRDGERRGSVLGEPRPGTLPADQRRAVLYGITNPERARARAEGRDRELCPGCAYRPVENRRTGLCEPCHLRRLAWAHQQEVVVVAARRELVTARQQKHRARELRG